MPELLLTEPSWPALLFSALAGLLAGLLLSQRKVRSAEREATSASARLAAEQAASAEKLALQRQNHEQLQQAFKALSAEALRDNNRSFLQLAQAQLERFQVEAKGDLHQRQEAIDQLVKPLRESLTKVDSRSPSSSSAPWWTSSLARWSSWGTTF